MLACTTIATTAAASSPAFKLSFSGSTTISSSSAFLPNPFCEGNQFCAFNDWINSFFYTDEIKAWFLTQVGPAGTHYLLTYLRDLFSGSILYYLTAGLWHIYIYHLYGDYFFKQQGFEKPSKATIRDQIQLAQASMFLYAALPVLAEWFIENGWTHVYYRVEEIGGWGYYLAFTLLYLAMVEVGIYWMHRTLHENKFLYKYIHGLHHKYNKPSTLSPWASVAFNPIDGILQASPYVACLFLVPVHYLTHVVLVFFTAIWATNIHDAMDGDTEPVMGSKYHTMHHTHYHYNFGQFFIVCDYLFGTLRVPESRVAKQKKGSSATLSASAGSPSKSGVGLRTRSSAKAR